MIDTGTLVESFPTEKIKRVNGMRIISFGSGNFQIKENTIHAVVSHSINNGFYLNEKIRENGEEWWESTRMSVIYQGKGDVA